tara:strand:- start:1374 stop:1814 length:441 start_codon:yes stop_codon:yes gene_type:complete
MKKSQLKQLLKPIVKECIQESLLEGGMLSNIIAEVTKGLQPLVETKTPATKSPEFLQQQQKELQEQRRELEEDRHQQLKEQKRKLLNATGLPSNVFEGVDPLATGGNADAPQDAAAGALNGVDPKDPGVDISGIMAIGGRNWGKMI